MGKSSTAKKKRKGLTAQEKIVRKEGGQKFVEELRDKCLDDIKSEVWKLETYRKTVDKYKETLRQQEANEDEI